MALNHSRISEGIVANVVGHCRVFAGFLQHPYAFRLEVLFHAIELYEMLAYVNYPVIKLHQSYKHLSYPGGIDQ